MDSSTILCGAAGCSTKCQDTEWKYLLVQWRVPGSGTARRGDPERNGPSLDGSLSLEPLNPPGAGVDSSTIPILWKSCENYTEFKNWVELLNGGEKKFYLVFVSQSS